MKSLLLLSFALLPLAALAQVDSRSLSRMTHPDTGCAARVVDYSRSLGASSSLEFEERLKPFYHGVASGDPLADRVIIWTRVTPAVEGSVDVQWRVATDTALQNVVRFGSTTTDQAKDYTVKVDVDGLQAGSVYYFGFTVLGKNSLTGRTRTVPAGSVERLRFAVASCSNYQHGYFNAYASMAERDDLDGVLFLGDYIYEYREGKYADTSIDRGHEPATETITLDDYRIRHSSYKLDPDLRRVHQQLPFIAVWDDHESANDSYRDGAGNHGSDEGDWQARKESSKKAYYEWMPVREREPRSHETIYRSLRYGDLLDLVMIDTRLEGRQKPLDSETAPGLNDPSRTILGPAQYAWLTQQLSTSSARWKVIGNQVVMAQVAGFANLDAWDGYPAERGKLFAHLKGNDIDNVVVLTGDIHSSWAGDLTPNPLDTSAYKAATGAGSIAVEFVTPSITSANFNETTGQAPRSQQAIDTENLLKAINPHLKFIELDSHGYLILDLTAERVQSDWYFVDTILVRRKGEKFAAAWSVRNGENHIGVANTPTASKVDAPAPAPLEPPSVPSGVSDLQKGSGLLVVGNYPNPFAASTLINYVLSEPSRVTITVYNVSGEEVAWLLDGQMQSAGIYAVRFDGAVLPAGEYFYTVRTEAGTVTRSMSVVR